MIGILGIFGSLALLIFLAHRGWNVMKADGTWDTIRRRHEGAAVDPIEDARRRILEEPFR